LVVARKNAAIFFLDRLESYVKAKSANTFDELKDAVGDDFGAIDTTGIFDAVKQKALGDIKADAESYSHPTVWREMVRQRSNLVKTNNLLNAAPEAAAWLS
jgi:hypothetical protein